MLNLPRQARLGLQKLSNDIQSLLKKDKKAISDEIPDTIYDKTETKEGKNAVFINNNYYQPQPLVSQSLKKKRGVLGFIKISMICLILGGCIAIGFILVISPEIFIDKIESIGRGFIEFLRSIFIR